MQSSTKESFKLLQLSEDSKSVSDLDLPEILTQRKRKIRRKTRNTSSNLRHSHHADTTPAACPNLGLWIAIFMSCGWLLILSYMTAVVYSENRRLEVQISKLSLTSQHVPDALQNWHETSKILEQNQTFINGKLVEVQQRMNSIDKQLTQIREQINQKESESDHQKVAILQNNVANFGAKIKDLSIDVDGLKEHVQEMKLTDITNKDNLVKLNDKLEAMLNSTSNIHANNQTLNAVNNMTTFFTNELKNLTNKWITANDTLSQKIKGVDEDVHIEKIKLDKLIENVANMSAKVGTIEADLIKYKQINSKSVNGTDGGIVNMKKS